jgi:hypothetical protein
MGVSSGEMSAALVRDGVEAWRRAVARDTWQRSAAVDVIEVGDPDLDAGQSNADGIRNARRLHGVSRADANCLSHPHNSGTSVLGCVCQRPALPTCQSPARSCPPVCPPTSLDAGWRTFTSEGKRAGQSGYGRDLFRPTGTVPHLSGNDTPALTWDFAYELNARPSPCIGSGPQIGRRKPA